MYILLCAPRHIYWAQTDFSLFNRNQQSTPFVPFSPFVRWVLIAFKREFPFDEILKLWEVLWTDYYTHAFVLFVALAVLESHRDMILRYLVEFDEILKVRISIFWRPPGVDDVYLSLNIQYCNELSMTIELDSTLAQAEVLFLSFSQIVADIDRRKAEHDSAHSGSRGLSGNLRNRLSMSSATFASVLISDELREVLGPRPSR